MRSSAVTPLVRGDVHTHIWRDEHLSKEFRTDLERAWPEAANVRVGYEEHAIHAEASARSVVLAFDAPNVGFVVPDDYVATYVATDPSRLIGFCSVDPARPDAHDRLARAVEKLGLRGVKIAPTYQGFDPLGSEAFEFYEDIARRHLPIVWHQGMTFVRRSVLRYAFPCVVDEVALRLPELRIVIAHLGHPWIGECIAVIRKHPNVYADISGLTPRPWQFREALMLAGEYRVANKLLFGTDFPFGTVAGTSAVLRAWADDPVSCEPLREACGAILDTDPLEVLGL